MLMADPVHGTHLHRSEKELFRIPEADQQGDPGLLRQRRDDAVGAPVGDRRDHKDVCFDLRRSQGQSLFHCLCHIAHPDLISAVADADGRDPSVRCQEQCVAGSRLAADVDAAHIRVDAFAVPPAALHGDEAHRLKAVQQSGCVSIGRVKIKIDCLDALFLEIAFTVAVCDDHRGEAESLQSFGKGHGAHRSVSFRETADIEARGEHYRAALPA